MKTLPLAMACLLGSATALAAPPKAYSQTKAAGRPLPCQARAPERSNYPQGTLLWGSARQSSEDEMSGVLTSVKLEDLRLEGGRLVASSRRAKGLEGATLQGAASNGQAVDVAICAEPTAGEELPWYRIEVWNAERASWENPCIATQRAPQPRALAVPGVWDSKGARQDTQDHFTFACENGAIAKCVTWGYAPWESRGGQSLAGLHQACTRMARADYCGDGRSHTHEDNLIDMYDSLGVQRRTTEATPRWHPEQASFEAAWGPEGAACLARSREGSSPKVVLDSCPERFELARVELGDGDTCALRRKGTRVEAALLRNRSYEPGLHASAPRP